MPGHEDDRQGADGLGQSALELQPVDARKAHVEDETPRRGRLRTSEKRFGGIEGLDFPALGPQHAGERLPDARVVVDDEDGLGHGGGAHGSWRRGKLTQNVAPAPGPLDTVRLPLCVATID